jgi:serine-type D-Ala-D-Ala carboxypeptidase/endopeptidase
MLRGFGILALSACPLLGQDLAAKVDALAQPLIAAGLAPSMVIGVIDGDTTIVRTFGKVGGKVGETAPNADTVYEIGSVSKVFTGILLADAVHRGIGKLDDTVQSWLPDGTTMPTFEGEPVLLWHLATHSSGLPRLPDMSGGDAKDPYAHFDANALLAAVGKTRVRWRPGSKVEYSNFGVGVLGHVLATKQGLASFAELLPQRLLAPLAMQDTAVTLSAAQRARLAPPMNADGEPEQNWDLAALAGAGGIRSTMSDMLKFAAAQWATKGELQPAMALAQKRHHDGNNGIALGLCWHYARDGQTLWHNGGTGGYHSYLAVVPGDRRAVCVLANTTAGEIDAVGEGIMQTLYGIAAKPLQPKTPVAVERALLQRLVGEYRMSKQSKFTITLGERGLSAQLTGQDAARIHAESPTEFFYRAVDARLVFELDGTLHGEQPKAVVLHQNGGKVRCVRIAADAAK